MKKSTLTILFSIISILFFVGISYCCTSIVVGKKASKYGFVIFGHNEDDGGLRVVNVWRVPRIKHKAGEMLQLIEGGKIPQVEETWSYIWFQVNGLKFSDYYMNEWGVHVASDACPSREDDPDLTDGGIGYMLRRIVAERARSAREGVMIAGELLDKFGYVSSGRTMVICDANEGWILSIVAGKHWVAQRVPDDGVVVLPNTYIIREVDFSDKENFITSKDNVRDYAIKRGWYDPKSGEKFDFAYTYMRVPGKKSRFVMRGYDTRQWRGQQLFSGRAASIKEARKNGLPFAVRPNRKITVKDVMAVLRDHYENTVYGPAKIVSVSVSPEQPSDYLGKSLPRFVTINPNFTTERTICTPTTQFSTVAQLRGDLPPDIGSVLWMCMGRPDVGVYVPWYSGINRVPDLFHNTPGIDCPFKALKHHLDPVEGTFDYDPDAAFWRFNDLENLVDVNYSRSIDEVTSVWKKLEKREFDLQPSIEETAIKLWKEDKELCREFLTQITSSFTQEALIKTEKIIKKLKTKYYH